MPTQIASTVFNTGAKDKLAALDAYTAKGQGSSVINSIQSLAKSLSSNSLFNSVLGGVGSLFNLKSGKIALNGDALMTRLTGSGGSIQGALSGFTSDVQKQFTSTFAAQTGFSTDKLSLKIGESGQFLASGQDYANLTAYSSLVNNHLGTDLFSVTDKTALGSLTASIIDQGSALGIPNMFGYVTENITDVTVLNAVVKESVPTLSQRGDIASLLNMSESSKVSSTIGILFPNFGQNIARNYGGLTSENYGQRVNSWSNLLTLFGNVDSNWNQFKRQNGAETGVNILSLMGASNDFQQIVRAGIVAYNLANPANLNHNGYAYALSTVYRETTVVQELRRFFPTLILEAAMTQYNQPYGNAYKTNNNKPIDPRLLGTAAKLLASAMRN